MKKSNKKNKLSISNFGKGVIFVAGGSVFFQIINLIFTPLITRIYSPEEFGILTVFTTIIGVFSFVGFKYEMAIPISENDKIAVNVLALSILLLFSFVIVLVIILLIFRNELLSLFNAELLIGYWFLIPLGVLLVGVYKIFYFWASRMKDYKNISRTTIGQGLSRNISKVLFGLMGFGGIGLVIGEVIGQSTGSTLLSKQLMRNRSLLKEIKFKTIFWCLKRYKKFPVFNLPSHFLSTLGEKAPVIFFTFLFGPQVVGFYGLAYTIVRLPISLIGKAVGNVFYAEAASLAKKDPKKLKNLSNKLIKNLILIGLIPMMTLLLIGPELFGLVFGDSWYESGEYARILSIMLFFVLVVTPVSRVYEVFEKQKIRFYIDILRLILVVSAFGFSFIFKTNPFGTLLLYSVALSFINLLIYIFAQRILNEEIKKFNYKT